MSGSHLHLGLPCRCGSTAVPTAEYGYWTDGLEWITEWFDYRCKNGHVFSDYVGEEISFHYRGVQVYRRLTTDKEQ